MNIIKDFDLTPFLTLKTKVVAENYCEPKTREEIIDLFKNKANYPQPYFFFGGGSNLAVLTDKIPGLTIKNNYRQKNIIQETDQEIILKVSSGYPVSLLVKEMIDAGYAGLENQFGLPGTVGGAVYLNSKWMHPLTYISDCLVKAVLIDQNGNLKEVEKEYFQFAYDYSILQKTKEIVLEVFFKLKKSDPEILQEKALATVEYRKKTQPTGIASSGCFFRNISDEDKIRLNLPTQSAGYLIDQCGLKGTTSGNFFVSDKHANFILNKGQGQPEDLLKLLELIKSKVMEKFGVGLKEEVVIVR